jgi:GH18 family chitinase
MSARSVVAALLILVSSTLAACAGNAHGSAPALPAPFDVRGATPGNRFVGYWDGWQANDLTSAPAAVTEIPIAFGFMRGHTITLGGINAGYVTAADIAALHARGIAVTLSIGGWSPYNSLVFDGDVAGFDRSLANVLSKLPFDGVDFDLEHGSTKNRVKTLDTLILAARAYFNSVGKPGAIVTYPAWNTPTGYGDDQILENPAVAAALSWVNVMSYEHNDVAAAESDVAAYGAIFDRSKITMGVDIDDKPIASNAELQALSAWVRSNGYGGMMAWTINDITAAQLHAITGK